MNSLTERSKGFTMKRASILGALVVALAGCGTTSPAPCQIQSASNGGYAVRLLRTAGQTITPACKTPTGTPEQIGDSWIFDVYETDPTNAAIFTVIGYSANLGLPDPNVGSSPLYARAQFTTVNPAPDSTCALANATMNAGAGGKYDISNWIWNETAVYLGTEFKADVTYTVGACTATYAAQAITPPVQCGANADCDPFAQPFSSGINPDYNQNCILGQAWTTQLTGDPATGICFFQEPFPSTGGYKSGT
jgi:hypothetical protein